MGDRFILKILFLVNGFALSIVSGLISGIVASAVFYFYMHRMRPRLFICDHIAKSQDKDGVYYCFKVYNLSSKYDILDLKFEVMLKTPFNSHGGQNYKIDRFTLKKENIMLIPRCSKKNETDGSYALVMTTRDDVESLWSNDAQLIELHVHARHSFSGATKSYAKKFYTKSASIKSGMFTFGKTNDVK